MHVYGSEYLCMGRIPLSWYEVTRTSMFYIIVISYNKEHGNPWLYDTGPLYTWYTLMSTVKVTNLLIYHVIVDGFEPNLIGFRTKI